LVDYVHVRGLRELQAAMFALPKKLDRGILNSALKAGAKPMVKDAQAKVPVDTGDLKSAIRAISVKPPVYTATVHVGIGKTRLTKARKKAGERAYTPWYGLLVEFGTSKMSARPFLRPAFERNKFAAVGIIKKNLAIAIEAEAEKLKR
jgi:HK97 gp10 family phage protein